MPRRADSFFNGMCPFNIFFQGVACSVMQLELEALGLHTTFEAMDISSPDAQWEGVRRRYTVDLQAQLHTLSPPPFRMPRATCRLARDAGRFPPLRASPPAAGTSRQTRTTCPTACCAQMLVWVAPTEAARPRVAPITSRAWTQRLATLLMVRQ